MRNKLKSFAVCVFFLLFFSALAGAQTRGLNNPSVNARTYLPGDFVHVVVEAPVDTAQITTTMPDSTPISLIQDRRSNVWRGIWQVPVDFKKGTYSASLTAVDVQGNVFTGQTDSFAVGELSMITLVGKRTKEAAAALPAPSLKEIITSEAPPASVSAVGQEQIISLIKKIITPPAPTPTPDISKATRDRLINSNLAAGKNALHSGNLTGAAAFFRIVLYLAPDNQSAGKLLVETQQKLEQRELEQQKLEQQKLAQQEILQQEAQKRFYLQLAAVIFAVIFVLAFLSFWLIRILSRSAGPAKPSQPLPNKENEADWLRQVGWQENPFKADVVKQLFPRGGKLEIGGLQNFIKSRIMTAGGKGLAPFTDAAIDKIYDLSKGNPDEAVKICDWSVGQAIRNGLSVISAETVRQYQIGPKKILIADDEELIRLSLDAILSKGGGYETDFAVDGEEALAKIKNSLYGAVMLDIDMPKLDGYETLKQVRSTYPELPVIFVTGKGIPQKTIESMAKYNLTGYIEKPFTPEKVLDLVARAINK